MSNTTRIAKNTIFLYFRQILIMLVSLYTVRVVLNVLGAEDYGIYNVVAGVVTMFSFLSGAMASASQRYFSFDLGKKDLNHLKITFNITFEIYLLLGILIVILAESFGLYFVHKKLVIPAERIFAAKWIYQFSIVSFVFSVLSGPFMADIIAHEDMNIYAYVSIVEAVLKLVIVFFLKLFEIDKLILYGFLLMLTSVITTSIYLLFCKIKYSECKIKFVWDKNYAKEIFSFTLWNMFGASVGVFKNQLTNILLNQYFNPIVNAAKGIASNVNSAVSSFSHNFSSALKPQIIKSWASENKTESIYWTFRGCKFTYFLMWIFTLPLVLEMEGVLTMWLKNPPENAILFTQLALIDCLIESVSYPIMTLAQATGKVKVYQSVVGGILLLNLPFSWICLAFGFPAFSVFVVAIFICILALLTRIIICKNLAKFSIRLFIKKVFFRCALVSVLSFSFSFLIYKIFPKSLIFMILKIILDILFVALFVFLFGLEKTERKAAMEFLKKGYKNKWKIKKR